MSLRTVSDTILRGNGQPYDNETVTFYLLRGSHTVSSSYPPSPVTVETDNDGYYEVELTPNTELQTPTTWRAMYPGHDVFEFTLTPGAPISMGEIRTIGLIHTWSAPSLATAMDAYRATWDAALEEGLEPLADAIGADASLLARLDRIDRWPHVISLGAAITAGDSTVTLRTPIPSIGAYTGMLIIDPNTPECEIVPVRSTPSGLTVAVPAYSYTPSFSVPYANVTTISFEDDMVYDSANGLGIFEADWELIVSNSDDASNVSQNNGVKTILEVAGDGSWLRVNGTFITQAAGDTLTLTGRHYATSFDSGSSTIFDATRTTPLSYGGFWRFLAGETVQALNSAGNNVLHVVEEVATDGTWMRVSGPLVTEGAGAPVTFRTYLRFDHAIDAPVLFVQDSEINFRWFGVKGDGLTASASGNVLGFRRAVRLGYRYSLFSYLLPGSAGAYMVNDEVWFERANRWRSEVLGGSVIRATTDFVFGSNDRAVLHQIRDGLPVLYETGGPTERSYFENIYVDGNSRRIIDEDPDVDPVEQNAGANGIICSLQQPQKWRNVRVDNCDGYGLCIVETQDAAFERLMFVGCGTAAILRSAQIIRFSGLDIEQARHVDGTIGRGVVLEAQDYVGAQPSQTVSFEHVHCEAGVGTGTGEDAERYFDIYEANNLSFKDIWITAKNPSTAFHIDYGSTPSTGGIVYTLQNVQINNSSGCIAVRDIQRGINRHANTWFRAFIPFYQPSATPVGAFYGMQLPGLAGRETLLGAPQSATAPNIDLYGPTSGASTPMLQVRTFSTATTDPDDGELLYEPGAVVFKVDVEGDVTSRDHTLTGHLIGSGAPTVANGAGAGTSPGAASLTRGSDLGGTFVITTGSVPPSNSASVATVTFATPYAAVPVVILQAAGTNAADLEAAGVVPYVASTTVNGFTIGVRGGALSAATAYTWSYLVVQ